MKISPIRSIPVQEEEMKEGEQTTDLFGMLNRERATTKTISEKSKVKSSSINLSRIIKKPEEEIGNSMQV
jgi:hypothetical protein